jgi:hypothetical protein
MKPKAKVPFYPQRKRLFFDLFFELAAALSHRAPRMDTSL